MIYYYTAFGLIIKSELKLPELNSIKPSEPDFQIRFGYVPNSLKTVRFKGILFETNSNEFLFRNDIVNIYICEGKDIWLHPNKNSSFHEIRLHVLGTGMGIILHQRGIHPLHGSSIVYQNHAYIFSGSSTSGKSSLAAAFAKKGYKILSDDISVITVNETGIFEVQPGIPHIKIWKDVQDVLNFPNVKKKVRPQLEKYYISHQIEFHDNPVPLEAVIVLNIKRSEGIEFSKVSGVEKFNSLRDNTFRIRIMDSSGHTESHFHTFSKLANSVELYKIKRASIPLNIKELADFIEQKIILADGN